MEYAEFSQKLRQLEQDIDYAARNTVNKTVLTGMRETMEVTPTHEGKYPDGRLGGTLQKGWEATPAHKVGDEWRGDYHNNVYYGPYVNWGHRVVHNGITVGWSPAHLFLEEGIVKAVKEQKKIWKTEFRKVKERGGW